MEPSRVQPGAYDPDLAQAVCLLVDEGVDLSDACSQPGMPSRGTILRWADEVPEFAEMLAASRRRSAALMVEDMVRRCEGKNLPDELQPRTPAERTARDRLGFAARRILLSLYDPERFGRIRGPSFGGGGGSPPGPKPEPKTENQKWAEHYEEKSRWYDAIGNGGMSEAMAAKARQLRKADEDQRAAAVEAAEPQAPPAPAAPALLSGAAAVEDARVEFRKELVAMSIPPGEIDGLMVEAEKKGLFDPRYLHEKFPDIYGPPDTVAPPPDRWRAGSANPAGP